MIPCYSYCISLHYPALIGFCHAWLLAVTRSFAWLVCRVVGLFSPREKAAAEYAPLEAVIELHDVRR